MDFDLRGLVVGQLEFYWEVHLRPRLDGLTDAEYLWEPVEGMWSLRLDDQGRWQIESQRPEPTPTPVTTIAWRMMHLAATCLGNRANAFFGDGSVPDDADMFDERYVPAPLPGTAAEAVAFLERAYTHWHDSIVVLDNAALMANLGPRGGPYADDTMAGLILHLNRETMHHGGEIGVLRDLYRAKGDRQ